MAVQNEHFSFHLGPATVIAADTEIDYYYSFKMPGKWYVTSVTCVPDDAVTANGTNYTVLTLTNVTASTTIATRSWIATNSVAGTAETATVTLGTGLARVLTEGDTLKLAKTDPGTGLALRARFIVQCERRPM